MSGLRKIFAILFVCLSICNSGAFGQKHGQPMIDSLLPLLGKAKEDTAKLNILGLLCYEYTNINPDSGLMYCQTELALAERLHRKKDIALSYNNKALLIERKDDWKGALEYLQKSLQINEELQDKRWTGGCLVNIGIVYKHNAEWDKALEYFYKARPILEESGDKEFLANDFTCIARVYMAKFEVDKALEFTGKALEVYRKIGAKLGMAACYESIAMIQKDRNQYDNAIENYTKCLKLAEELKMNDFTASTLMNLGFVYSTLSDNPKALEFFFKALAIAEKVQNKELAAAIYVNIGGVYKSMGDNSGDFANAIEYYTKALKASEELGDKDGMGMALINLGTISFMQKDYAKSRSQTEQSLKLMQDVGNKIGEGRALGSLAFYYEHQKDYQTALEYGFRALKIFEQINNKEQLGWQTSNIGQSYLSIAKDSTGNVKYNTGLIPRNRKECINLAIKYIAEGVQIDKEIGVMQDLMNCYETLSEAKALAGDYKGALEAYTNYTTIKDSVYSQQNARKIANSTAQREAELKQKQIEVQQLQIVAAKNERKYYIAGLVAFLLLSGGLFSRFQVVRKNKKQLEEKNKAIAAEKENADLMRQRAETSERFKQQFLANMSHEIRTPMNAVNGMTDLLLEKGPRPDQVEYLTAISKSSDILLHIINDILDLSKIEAGKLELEKIDFSLEDTLKQVKDTLSYKAEEKGLQLITHIAGNVPEVLAGDPYRLNQVLVNLGGNAIKFTDRGGVQLNVKLLSEDNCNATLQFSVTDTGKGIPKDKLQNLFEDFAQVNSSDTRKFGGTGLGLSISKQLVELQNGSIGVESTEGSGTTFYFTITYPIGSAKKLQQRVQSEQKADGSMLDGLRILIADDNEYNRLVVNETLQLKAKVHTDMVTNGQEAIQKLLTRDYDVILMDVQMPVMNGIEATKYIRTKMGEGKNGIPIIALTASVLKADLDMCSGSGMNSYVPKPFKAWQLIQTIAEVTSRKKGQMTNEPKIAVRSTTIPGEVTDLTYLKEFCEGDDERMKKYIDLYLKAAPVFREKLTAAAAAKDLDEIALQVHSFKPKWMMMGMRATNDLATKIDQLCKEGSDKVYADLALLMQQADQSIIDLQKKVVS